MFEGYSWFSKLPSDTLSECTENLNQFFEVMYERQMIWKRRFLDKKPRPWTDNKIFQESKFTNVYRELDRNSQWQIKNIILDNSLSERDLIWKMMVFRFFNCPETFEFGKKNKGWKNGIPSFEEYNEDEFAEFIKEVRESGQNPYTTAYLINSSKNPRDYHYTRIVIPTLHKKIDELISIVKNAKKPEDIINFLLKLPAVAAFIAHEFYQDFTYIPRYTDRTFMKFNQNDFTNVGPGASIGIRLIFPYLKGVDQKLGIYWLRDRAEEALTEIAKKKGEPMPYLEWDKKKKCYYVGEKCNITLHQIEMWLCEYQKYWKMIIGMGKQRSKFEPKTKELIVK